MSQRIVGLVVACVLALFGGASAGVPAAAAPKSATVKANASKDGKPSKAAKARAAQQKAANEARLRAAKAAAQARAKAVAAAKARAAAIAKAKAVAAAKARAAEEARVDYAAQARPRAVAAARAVTVGKLRAKVTKEAAARAKTQAAVAAKAAVATQARAVVLTRAAIAAKAAKQPKAQVKAAEKARKKAVKAAKAAAEASVKARADLVAATGAAAKAKAAVPILKKAAKKAKKAAGPNSLWAPKDSLVFNHPRGSKKQKYAIINQLNKAIDAVPAGGEIKMAMYLFDINSVAKKLNAATRRGVSVQILIDDGATNKYIRKVKKVAGKNKKAASFVATCHRGCMSNGASVIHAKFYLFSVAGQARYVSMISSANPYTGNTYKSWNNNHMIVGDKRIYYSLSKYFTDMLADKKNLNYYRVTSSGKYTIYLYPQKVRRPEDVVLLNVLNHTSCRTTVPGYGSDGRTLIRVANWGWTGARLDIAKRLWKLHDGGCKVQVMVNKGRTSRNVLKALLKKSKKHGQMKVYNAWYDRNNNDVANLYVHHKMVTVNGMLGGRNVKITWTGSQNFTSLATISNNDMILRVVDPAVTDAYNTNFAYIRDNYTRRMRSVPWVTRIARP
jgi:hypothetical protein